MERGLPLMRRAVLLLLLWLASPAESRDLVLVVREDSPVREVDPLTLRKLYLGFTVTVGDRPLRALRLVDSTETTRAFMQNVIGMTSTQYESRLLRLTLKHGRPAPVQLSNPEDMIAVLSSDPSAVGCLWTDQVPVRSRLRVVRLLWRG